MPEEVNGCTHDKPVRHYFTVPNGETTFFILCDVCGRKISDEEYQQWYINKFLTSKKRVENDIRC
jgi:hypothetical protein